MQLEARNDIVPISLAGLETSLKPGSGAVQSRTRAAVWEKYIGVQGTHRLQLSLVATDSESQNGDQRTPTPAQV